jgi:predicted Rossmann-fold nucleotide-binding protein
MRALCVFLGSSPGTNPAYAEAAIATGRELARRGLVCVYGGSNTGLMRLLENAEREGFLRASHRASIFRAATPEQLIARMLEGSPP